MPSWPLADQAHTHSDLDVTLTLSDEGELSLAVARAGDAVVTATRLGLVAAHADLSHSLRFIDESVEDIDDSYTTLIGSKREHRYQAQERTLRFANGDDELSLHVRVSAEGVAFRYTVPWRGPVTVRRETAEYVVPGDSRAILLPYDNGRSDYEEIHNHSTVAAAAAIRYGYPALFEVSNTWLLITESNLDRNYAGSRLVFDGEKFAIDLPDPFTTAESPLVTPWRTLVIGELASIVESDLVTSLARPSQLADTSWIRPGVAAWSWWSDHLSPQDFDAQRRWVDFAAEQGWPYVLVDEWWNRTWAPELIAYAKERGVGIWVWSHWQHLDSEVEHRESLAVWKSWGIVGVKIDFTESDGQDRMRWFDSILAATAALELMVVFHGGTIPRGLERTWPHFMTAEAVKGAEHIKPGEPEFPPTHYLSLAFTRNVQGPMDFTPCTFTASRSISEGFELALSVIYTSGVQHFADSMEAYRARPEALRLLRRVPTVWDESRLLAGDPTDSVVVARRDGDDWFVGAGTAGAGRDIIVDLDFLQPGAWSAEIFQDGPDDTIVVDTVSTRDGGKLTIPVATNGGFTAHLQRVESVR